MALTPQQAFRIREREKKIAAGGFEQTFTYKGKTYTLPTRFPKKDIEKLKEFLKSFDEWKTGGGNFQSYIDMPSRTKAMAAAKKVGKKTSAFDNRAGNIWRRLVQYAKGKAPVNPGRTGTGELYKIFFDQLDIPKKELNVIKDLDFKNIQKFKQGLITSEAAVKKVGNPLIKTVIDVVKKNPNITTEQELFVNVSKAAGKGLSNSEIVKAAILAHRAGSTRLLKEARKEVIGETQIKSLKDFKSEELPKALKTLYNIFPNQIGRDFSGTIKDFYKDNPTLRKRALDKLNAYGKIRVELQKTLGIGGKGPGKSAFQFDHPISFAALQRSGDIQGAIRTNPIVGDVNQFKGKFLDRKLNNLQRAIMRGEDVAENIAKVEKLKNINQTLLGNLAGDFSIDEKGIIKVKDYGAPAILDKQYDIAKSLQKNLPLGGQIKSTIASGKLTPQLTEIFGEKGAKSFIASSQKLIEFADKDINNVCRIFVRSNRAEGGMGCAGQMAQALDEDPIGTGNKIKDLKVEGGAVNRVKNAATAFLKFAGKGKTFAVTAGVGAGAGALVKAFRNDDPTTYLTNDKQANAMILDTADQLEREERQAAVGDAPELLDEANIAANLGVTAAAVPGSKKVFDARKKKGFGAVRAGLGPVGKALSGFATPLGIAAITPLNVASQVYQGDSAEEILTDPLNYLGPAFAGTLTKEATVGMPKGGMLNKALRLGMSPAGVRGISKFFGLPGLALSLGYEGYDQYKKYTEGRGFVYNLLNKDE
jgi:hypothetical protein